MSDSIQSHAEETPTCISINGIAHAVMMITPVSLESFAIGFAFSEGIIDSIDQVRDLEIAEDQHSIAAEFDLPPIPSVSINLTLSPRQFQTYKEHCSFRRGLTSCGICGSSALKEALPPLTRLIPSALPASDLLANVRNSTPSLGGVHFAKLMAPDGKLIAFDKDIGRHNALDKVIGAALRKQIDLHKHYAILSSRCSVELIQKAVRAGLSTLIHLSSPSNLAIEMAKHYQLNLLQITHSNDIKVHALAYSEKATS